MEKFRPNIFEHTVLVLSKCDKINPKVGGVIKQYCLYKVVIIYSELNNNRTQILITTKIAALFYC